MNEWMNEWMRCVRAANTFDQVSLRKWSMQFWMYDLMSLQCLPNWKVFFYIFALGLIFAVFLPNFLNPWDGSCQDVKFLALCIPNLEMGSQNLESNPQTLPHFSRIFCYPWDKVYLCTKFKVSSYTRSKFTKEIPKFTNLTPGRPPHLLWGGI